METNSQTSSQSEIIPRNIDLALEDVPRYWYEGDPFKTRFFDAMSTLFPQGERFFIETVRRYRDDIQDPTLKDEVKSFIRQEGNHGRLHDAFNNRLRDQGIWVGRIMKINQKVLDFQLKKYSPKLGLSCTCGAEHLTAMMGHAFMENKDMFEHADRNLRALYLWHAVEEIEHKSVCFDVYNNVAEGSYLTRILGLIIMTLGFGYGVIRIMLHMLSVDKQNSPKVWLKGLSWMWGRKGIGWKLIPEYFSYFLPGFHPWKKTESPTFTQWKEAFDSTQDAVFATDQRWNHSSAIGTGTKDTDTTGKVTMQSNPLADNA